MPKKRVLILCTGNSCRSIMAEALVNVKLGACVEAESSGVSATGKVNPQAEALLRARGLWRDTYRSKVIDEVIDKPFDLVVTVCDNAKETCPIFPRPVPQIHLPFHDPHGEPLENFMAVRDDIRARLVPAVREALGL